jgi:type III secretion protein S
MPTILVAAIVGTLFSLLQALTQIQEQTLSFAVKLIAVGIVLFLTAGWMGSELVLYTNSVFSQFEISGR